MREGRCERERKAITEERVVYLEMIVCYLGWDKVRWERTTQDFLTGEAMGKAGRARSCEASSIVSMCLLRMHYET